MRILLIVLMVSLLGACSSEAPMYYGEPDKKDLNDPDNDGVINARDICRGTVPGALVDHYGCGIDEAIDDGYELLVFFDNDKSIILPNYDKQVSRFATYMKEYPEISVTVEGHTSAAASEEYNFKLSQRRANAVRSVLIDHGIDPMRVEVAGYGEEQLWLEGGILDQSAAGNRRVRVYVHTQYRINVPKWTVFSIYED